MRSYTRRQLKQDQFTAAFTERVHWAVEHRQKLIWGAVVVAAALAVGLTVWGYTHYRQSRANEALARAMQTYNAPIRPAGEQPAQGTQSFASASERSKAAHAEFARVADQYSSTRSGRLARYFSGVTAVELGDNAAAERDLKKAAETGDSDLSALAKLALANLYRNTNRQADAVKLYKDLIDHPTRTVSKPAAQLELATVFASTQPDEARRIYEQIKKENPQGAASQIADSRLQGLK